MNYTPDNWVVIGAPNGYKVLAGWSGGYLSGDSWRLNSGVTNITFEDPFYLFEGASGSVYRCHKDAYGLRINNSYIWNQLKEKYGDKVELLPEETDWLNITWRLTDDQ
jgi:hypothetical protein